MEPYNADYDAYSSGQEAAEHDEILHDIWLYHQRIERSLPKAANPEQPTGQPGRDGFSAPADSGTMSVNKRAQSRSPK